MFRLDVVQKTKKTKQDANDLSGSTGNIISELSICLETLCGFGLDAVQNTMKIEKTVNELSGSPGKHNFEHYQHS